MFGAGGESPGVDDGAYDIGGGLENPPPLPDVGGLILFSFCLLKIKKLL